MIPVPQTILAALSASYGATAESVAHFAGGGPEGDGVIYAYPYGRGRRLLKVMVMPAAESLRGLHRLEERLRFVHYLGENGARIVYPLPSPQGNLYEAVSDDEHLWVAYAMELAPGQTPAHDGWDEAFIRAWGQAIGGLHRLAQGYPTWRSSTDPITGDPCLTWQEEWVGFRDWCQDGDVRQAWGALGEELDALPVTRDSFGFIHNDPHIWNLRAEGNRVTLLDFDVSNHHWFMTDIGVALQSVLIFLTGGLHGPLRDHRSLLAFLRLFVEGYERENHLTAEWWNRLDLFIAYRRILLFIAMNDWARSQPGLLASWREMILTRPDVAGPAWYPEGGGEIYGR